MIRQTAQVVMLALVTVTLIALHGCRGDVSEDPFLTERFRKIEDQLEKLRNVPLEIQELRKDIDALTVKLGQLEQNPVTGGPEAMKKLQDIEANLATLEKRVQMLTTQLAAVQKQPAATPSAAATPARTPTTLRTTPPAVTPTPTPSRVTPTPLRPTPSPTPAPTPGGRYEMAQKGDTLQQFADRYGVSVPALVKANRVILMDLQPSDEIPVQRYWIPAQ